MKDPLARALPDQLRAMPLLPHSSLYKDFSADVLSEVCVLSAVDVLSLSR
jgi:hypothetical protein